VNQAGSVETNSKTGKELDGGGHKFDMTDIESEAEAKAKAERQLGYIQKWEDGQ